LQALSGSERERIARVRIVGRKTRDKPSATPA